jgi:hypothetical protein
VIVTPPPAPEPIRFETLLSLSWSVFRRNWIVALPPVIAMLIVLAGMGAFAGAVVAAGLARGGLERSAASPTFWPGIAVSYLVLVVVMLVVGLWSFAAMYGMADAAWAKGTATFGDGFAAFRTRSGALIVAFIGLAGVAIAAFILMLPTLGLALLALPLVTMYVVPSVVSGGRGGFAAIGESFRLVRRFFGASAIALLVLLGIQYGISFLATFAILPLEFAIIPGPGQTEPHMPPLGLILVSGMGFVVAMLAAQAYTGYYAIAIVGLYRSLFAQPSAAEPASGLVTI